MEETTKRDIKIYQAFQYLRSNPTKPGVNGVRTICQDFGISRGTLYEVIERVKNGNPAKIKKALAEARLEVLWKYKYQPRYLALPKDRKPATIAELQEIIRAMDADEFPGVRIASLLKKDRSTIIHHLDK